MKSIKQAAKAIQFFKSLKELSKDRKEELALAQIQKVLGEERTLFLKIGQFLGLKKDYEKILAASYAFEQVLSFDEAKLIFLKEFGVSFDEKFEFINRQAKSASLSQVFFCKEKASKEVLVLKTQLPGVKESIQSQLKLLNLLPNAGPAKKWGVDIEAYKKSISNLLDKELDFQHEISLMQTYEKTFESHSTYCLPKLYPYFQASHIYFQTEIPGEPLIELLKSETINEGQKRFALRSIFEFQCISFIKAHMLQTDTNLGNFHLISARDKLQLGALDFGAVKTFDKSFILGVLRLYLAVKNKSEESPISLLVAVGFDAKKLNAIRAKLPILLNLLFEPFVSSKPVVLSNWNLNSRLDSLLGEHKWWFRSAGGQDFFLLMKAFSSYIDLSEKWKYSICFSEIIDKHLSAVVLDVLNLDLPKDEHDEVYLMSLMASEIMVHIKENGKDKVKLKMPIRIIDDLESFMDEEILLKLQQRGISCKDKVESFLQNGGKPAVLFSFQDGAKDYLVKAL